MPTYEYKCDACGNAFERFQTMSSAPVKKCPKCGKNKVRRLIGTGAGLIFKGSGFYITDYRDQSYTDKAKAESGGGGTGSDSASGDKKTDGKTESPKTDAKPAAATAEPKPAAKADAAPAKAPAAEKKPKKK